MGIKQKLVMGIATGALAVSMIGGGTYAYFSDTSVNSASFTAGTLDISVTDNGGVNHATLEVDKIKPGDTITREFKLNNIGNLDVSQVLLTSTYTVKDKFDNNVGKAFGNHINVKLIRISDDSTILDTSLQNLTETDIIAGLASEFSSNGTEGFKVEFKFVDNDRDQNAFQGYKLGLDWTFVAKQTDGIEIQ